MVLAAVVAILLIAIGASILLRAPLPPSPGRPAPDGALLFAAREIFLGVLCLALILFKEWRGLFLLFAVALFLPVADILLLYSGGAHPFTAILLSNLPFELPLILVCILLAPALRAEKI